MLKSQVDYICNNMLTFLLLSLEDVKQVDQKLKLENWDGKGSGMEADQIFPLEGNEVESFSSLSWAEKMFF